MTERPETLFHFTSRMHLPHILRAGELTTTESNVSIRTQHAGPDVLWALDTDWMPLESHLPHGLSGMKTEARITFRTPKRAVRWLDWDWTKKMDPTWKAIMIKSGGGLGAAKHWWVVPHPVISRHWTKVEVIDGGKWKQAKLRESAR